MLSKTYNLHPEDWVNKYGEKLYTYALLKSKNKEQAEDWVQETFLAGLGAKDSFRGDSSELTWLYSILKNKIAQFYRKASTKQEVPLNGLFADQENDLSLFFNEEGTWKEHSSPRDWQLDPAMALENKELGQILNHCLDNLKPGQKEIIVLKLMEGLGSKFICKDLGISDTNYWIQIHRAKLQLRACIEKKWLTKQGKYE